MLALLAAAPALAQPARYEAWAWPARPLDAPEVDTLDAARPPDDWLGRDKALHAAGSFLLTLSAQYVLTAKLAASEGDALPVAAGTALALGVVKEVADGRRPVDPLFSARDLVADAVGVLLAVGVVLW